MGVRICGGKAVAGVTCKRRGREKEIRACQSDMQPQARFRGRSAVLCRQSVSYSFREILVGPPRSPITPYRQMLCKIVISERRDWACLAKSQMNAQTPEASRMVVL